MLCGGKGGGGGEACEMSVWTPRSGSSTEKHCGSAPRPHLVRAVLTSYIILTGPVRPCSLNRGYHSDPVWWESCDTYHVAAEQNEATKYLGVSPLWLEATIWPTVPEFEPLSARLHWNSLWVILTSMSLFVLFHWVLWAVGSPPCWIWGVVASLGQNHCWPRRLVLGFQTALADTAHGLAQSLLYRLCEAVESTQGDRRMQWLTIPGSVHPIQDKKNIVVCINCITTTCNVQLL